MHEKFSPELVDNLFKVNQFDRATQQARALDIDDLVVPHGFFHFPAFLLSCITAGERQAKFDKMRMKMLYALREEEKGLTHEDKVKLLDGEVK